MKNIQIVKVTEENISKIGLGCLKNIKHDGFNPKKEWVLKNLKNGLVLKVLVADGKPAGMIEYIPGSKAWRAVAANDVMFIHCLWITDSKIHNSGLGSLLIEDCIKDARQKGFKDVAVMTSDKAWMAKKDIFLKNGFSQIQTKERYELLATSGNVKVSFNKWEEMRANIKGLNLFFANQCPMFTKSVNDLTEVATAYDISMNVIPITNYLDAQNAPTGYGVFSLIKDGRLLADHYISGTRFRNILKKEYRV